MIKVRLPDGRAVNVDTDDPAVAARAASRFMGGGQQTQAETPETSIFSDSVKQLATGVVNGTIDLLTLPGTTQKMVLDLIGVPASVQKFIRPSTRGELTENIESATGAELPTLPEPETTAGKFARTIGEFAPGALAPGSAAQKVAQTVLPAVASEAAGQAAEGTAAEAPARIAGAVAGAVTPSALARAVTPLVSTKATQRAVANLKREGVTSITAGQKTDSVVVRGMESELGGLAAANVAEKGKRQFTSAVLRRVGVAKDRSAKIESGNDLTEIIDESFDRIGGTFDRVAKGRALNLDTRAMSDIADAFRDYMDVTAINQRIPGVEKIVERMVRAAQSRRPVGGEAYMTARSRLGKQAQALRVSNPDAAHAIRTIQGALDAAFERSIPASLAAQLKTARKQYRNLLVVEDAASRAGQDAARGIINPRQLRASVRLVAGKRAIARGRDDLGRLARDGEAVLTDLPNSGTPSRLRAQNLGASLFGAGAGGALGGVEGALLGAFAPAVAGRALVSAPGRALVGNQLTAPLQRAVRPGQSALVAGGLATANNR